MDVYLFCRLSSIMKYIFICILFTFIPVSSEPDTCLFTPHSSLSCLEYWVPPGVKHDCIETTVRLEFAGLSHHLNGEIWINLHHRGENVSSFITHNWYVRVVVPSRTLVDTVRYALRLNDNLLGILQKSLFLMFNATSCNMSRISWRVLSNFIT